MARFIPRFSVDIYVNVKPSHSIGTGRLGYELRFKILYQLGRPSPALPWRWILRLSSRSSLAWFGLVCFLPFSHAGTSSSREDHSILLSIIEILSVLILALERSLSSKNSTISHSLILSLQTSKR